MPITVKRKTFVIYCDFLYHVILHKIFFLFFPKYCAGQILEYKRFHRRFPLDIRTSNSRGDKEYPITNTQFL